MRFTVFLVLIPLLTTEGCTSLNLFHDNDQDTRRAVREAEYHLAASNYGKALDTYSYSYRRDPQNRALRDHFIETIEQIKTRGDEAFHHHEYATAGTIYYAVHKKCNQHKDITPFLSFDSFFLHKQIRSCSKILTENGLEKYREGNIGDAIFLWKTVISFDPENREVQKAIDTATIQLENLKAIP